MNSPLTVACPTCKAPIDKPCRMAHWCMNYGYSEMFEATFLPHDRRKRLANGGTGLVFLDPPLPPALNDAPGLDKPKQGGLVRDLLPRPEKAKE